MTTNLIVEDGTCPTGANSYLSMDDCAQYASDRGLIFVASPSDPGAQALIRATMALDGKFRAAYPGYRTLGRQQSLEWPRTAAYDYEGIVIDTKTIPTEVKNALAEMAIRELATPGILAPDLERGGDIRSIKAGTVAIEYGNNSTPDTIYLVINRIMQSLIGPVQSPNAATASRG